MDNLYIEQGYKVVKVRTESSFTKKVYCLFEGSIPSSYAKTYVFEYTKHNSCYDKLLNSLKIFKNYYPLDINYTVEGNVVNIILDPIHFPQGQDNYSGNNYFSFGYKEYLKIYKEFLLKLASANLDGNGYVVCEDFYINCTGIIGSNVVYDGTSLICIDESKIKVLASKDAAKIIALCGGLKCLHENFPPELHLNSNKAIKIMKNLVNEIYD